MRDAAASLRRLAAAADEAAGALRRARFGELADAAAELEAADLQSLRLREIRDDPEAVESARELRQSLDRLGALLGHVAGVRLALRALDPAYTDGYDRGGAVVERTRRAVREEA